jgi:HAD superfamily phosphoserine phosphatase-like hydrolase
MSDDRTAFAFDLDGTVTRQELLPLMAAEVGLVDEMRMLTDLTMAGHIPFEQSFRLRCAALGAVPVSRVREIVAGAQVNHAVEAFIRKRPDSCFIVTGNLDAWIEPLADRLGCRVFSSVAATEGDRLVGVRSVLDKAHPIRELRRVFTRVVAVGDGANDVPMFREADVGVAFGGTHEPAAALMAAADHVVNDEESLCRLLSTLSSPLLDSALA